MSAIRKDFLPSDLIPSLNDNGVEGTVAVQADQTEDETDYLLSLAKENPFIKGVVGWVDLRCDNLSVSLARYAKEPLVKGFRHVLQGESPSFMLEDKFLRGIAELSKYGFAYDILIFPRHLEAAFDLVKQFPNQPFVIDHIAKPDVKNGTNIAEWKSGMAKIAMLPNVSCKISGMVTEADYKHWHEEQFAPLLAHVVEIFGEDRLMFGSDWPVCNVAASYQQITAIGKDFLLPMGEQVLEKIFRTNALKFYRL